MSSVIASYDDAPMDDDADSDAEDNDDHEADVHNESQENEPAPSTPPLEQAGATTDEVAKDAPMVEPESAVKVTSTERKSVQKSLATFFQCVNNG